MPNHGHLMTPNILHGHAGIIRVSTKTYCLQVLYNLLVKMQSTLDHAIQCFLKADVESRLPFSISNNILMVNVGGGCYHQLCQSPLHLHDHIFIILGMEVSSQQVNDCNIMHLVNLDYSSYKHCHDKNGGGGCIFYGNICSLGPAFGAGPAFNLAILLVKNLRLEMAFTLSSLVSFMASKEEKVFCMWSCMSSLLTASSPCCPNFLILYLTKID